MKEVLIYGALVAAIIGASVPVITNLQTTFQDQGQALNGRVNTAITDVMNAIPSGGDSSGN